MPAGDDVPPPWVMVVPVKRLDRAKTRLAVPAPVRASLALAMAKDVVTAGLDCALVLEVLAVTDDAQAAEALRGLGAVVEPDAPDAGLNAALEHGSRAARARIPGAAVALVSSDVAGVSGEELGRALRAATRRAFVADSRGDGTTALLAPSGVEPAPAFGPGSAARHAAGGAVPLAVELPWLRHDVDDLAGLQRLLEAAPVTAARHTRHAAGEAGPWLPSPA